MNFTNTCNLSLESRESIPHHWHFYHCITLNLEARSPRPARAFSTTQLRLRHRAANYIIDRYTRIQDRSRLGAKGGIHKVLKFVRKLSQRERVHQIHSLIRGEEESLRRIRSRRTRSVPRHRDFATNGNGDGAVIKDRVTAVVEAAERERLGLRARVQRRQQVLCCAVGEENGNVWVRMGDEARGGLVEDAFRGNVEVFEVETFVDSDG